MEGKMVPLENGVMCNGSIMAFSNAIFCIQNVAVIELSYYEANYDKCGGYRTIVL